MKIRREKVGFEQNNDVKNELKKLMLVFLRFLKCFTDEVLISNFNVFYLSLNLILLLPVRIMNKLLTWICKLPI